MKAAIVPIVKAKVARIYSLKMETLKYSSAKMFNTLPKCLRENSGTFENFKEMFDELLSYIPDCPSIPGYFSHNLDSNNSESNVLSVWLSNMNLEEWQPTPGEGMECED